MFWPFNSAGVGRTGTFIVIDHCLENFARQEQNLSVDVFHIVQEMRKCRVNMIQTLVSYYYNGKFNQNTTYIHHHRHYYHCNSS